MYTYINTAQRIHLNDCLVTKHYYSHPLFSHVPMQALPLLFSHFRVRVCVRAHGKMWEKERERGYQASVHMWSHRHGHLYADSYHGYASTCSYGQFDLCTICTIQGVFVAYGSMEYNTLFLPLSYIYCCCLLHVLLYFSMTLILQNH